MDILQPPALKIDRILHPDGRIHPIGRAERRVLWNLMAHLAKVGFNPHSVVWDEVTMTPTPEAVMEMVFNLDDCWVHFGAGADDAHSIYVVLGNDGVDCISDWNYYKDDRDGFNKAMEAFDPELFA